jgi:phosphoglycolate phosphatase
MDCPPLSTFQVMVQPDRERRRIRAILFDKDGTLFKFNETWVPVFLACAKVIAEGNALLERELLMKAGLNVETQTLVPGSIFNYGTVKETAAQWFPVVEKYRITSLDQLIRTMETHSQKLAIDNAVAAVEDMPKFFGHLKHDLDLVLGLVTCDSTAGAERVLVRHQVREFFDFVAGYDGVWPVKPDPMLVESFTKLTGIVRDEIAIVGDAPRDMMLARNAQVAHAIGVLTGPFPHETLAPLADVVLSSIGELENYLKSVGSL